MKVKVLAARQQKKQVYKFVKPATLLKLFSELQIYISANPVPLHYQSLTVTSFRFTTLFSRRLL